MKEITIEHWRKFFPLKEVRAEQETAINFVLNAFVNKNKRYCITEVGVGGGKSAIAVTVANFINEYMSLGPGITPGAYILTTQKILQEQYMRDFSRIGMHTIKSASNYQCKHHINQSCGESKRVLAKLGKQLEGTDFAKCCKTQCGYTLDKQAFINAFLGITNFPYFLSETSYAGKLEPRNLLVIDEAHNTAEVLSSHVEVTFSERFAKDVLKCKVPTLKTQQDVVDWIGKQYRTALVKYIKSIEKAIESNLISGSAGFGDFAKQYDMLDKHICKVNRFLETYNAENWVMNVLKNEDRVKNKRGFRKFEFKTIDVSGFSHESLFKFGQYVLLMSATIIDKDIFCRSLGIDAEQCEFISIPSPFPVENRPVHYFPVGKMSADSIMTTLPNMVMVIKELLNAHATDKGIIHGINWKIVNYIRDNIKDPRLLIQDESNRDMILQKHYESSEPTVLVSPSMLEGVDLKDDLSRFQIFCKMPFPYMGDAGVKKRMERDKNWYPYVTVRSIIQAAGRSIRNDKDHAETYILDACWETFYRQNRLLFPDTFRASVIKS